MPYTAPIPEKKKPVSGIVKKKKTSLRRGEPEETSEGENSKTDFSKHLGIKINK